MAIEPIEKLTRPLSRKEEKKVASHDAPEDYLKRARESFIIEFPEFEDLWGEELDKEMEKKGWFSDEYASDPSPYDMSGWYDIYTDMQSNGELPGWMDSFDKGPNSFMQNLDVLDISPWDFVQRKGKKEVQVASGPPAFDDAQLEKGAIEIFGKPLKDLTDDEYEELEDMIREMDVSPWDFVQRKGKKDIRQVNQGGIIGLRYGGDPRIEQQPEGITQLASHTGEDVIQSAIIWAAGLPQFGSIGSVLDALNNVDHPHAMDINGLVNAYMDARVDSN